MKPNISELELQKIQQMIGKKKLYDKLVEEARQHEFELLSLLLEHGYSREEISSIMDWPKYNPDASKSLNNKSQYMKSDNIENIDELGELLADLDNSLNNSEIKNTKGRICVGNISTNAILEIAEKRGYKLNTIEYPELKDKIFVETNGVEYTNELRKLFDELGMYVVERKANYHYFQLQDAIIKVPFVLINRSDEDTKTYFLFDKFKIVKLGVTNDAN